MRWLHFDETLLARRVLRWATVEASKVTCIILFHARRHSDRVTAIERGGIQDQHNPPVYINSSLQKYSQYTSVVKSSSSFHSHG